MCNHVFILTRLGGRISGLQWIFEHNQCSNFAHKAANAKYPQRCFEYINHSQRAEAENQSSKTGKTIESNWIDRRSLFLDYQVAHLLISWRFHLYITVNTKGQARSRESWQEIWKKFYTFSSIFVDGGEKGLAIGGGHAARMALRFVLKVPKRSWQQDLLTHTQAVSALCS